MMNNINDHLLQLQQNGDVFGASAGLMFPVPEAASPMFHHGVPPPPPWPLRILGVEVGKMRAQEIMDAKALAASKSHSEAERRRRQRINNHLANLRTLLPTNTKTDKASLLAEVIEHVKELKRQTSVIAETSAVPTEADELTVEEDGRAVIKASLCCEDRSDLLPDLIKALKALRLRTVKAEITMVGGRLRNVLFLTGEEEEGEYCVSTIQEALKAVMDKNNGAHESGSTVKRQTTNNNINIINSTH